MDKFCDLADLSVSEIDQLINQAYWLEQKKSMPVLQGKVLALLFLNPSLRTLTSFQATMTRLGGGSFVVSPEMSIHGLETRSGIVMDGNAAEHIREAVPVIASYADAIGIRVLADRISLEKDLQNLAFNELTSLCDIPVINMESSIRHPCQSLSDWKTLDDLAVPRNGGKLVFTWVYHPEALPLAVVGDTIHMACMRGMDVSVLRPEGFELPNQIVSRAEFAASSTGGSLLETSDKRQALSDAHVVYAGSWSSTEHYGNRAIDLKIRNKLVDWRVDETWFSGLTSDSCRFMHCLPVRRGVEVEDQLLDGARSVVIQQARNRLYTQMSVLLELLN